MTSQQIESLIAQGEGYNIEFKQSIPSKASELAEEICAFANAAGGTLLIGIDDKGAVDYVLDIFEAHNKSSTIFKDYDYYCVDFHFYDIHLYHVNFYDFHVDAFEFYDFPLL